MYIYIPCKFENQTLTVKSLGFQAEGKSADEALLSCIKGTTLYAPLAIAKFKEFTDHRNRVFQGFEVLHDDKIMKKIAEVEPTVEDKKRKSKSSLIEPDSEDILRLGYPL